jgi:hypothetical protein
MDVLVWIIVDAGKIFLAAPIQWLWLQFYEKSDTHTSYRQGEQKGSRFLILSFDSQPLLFYWLG